MVKRPKIRVGSRPPKGTLSPAVAVGTPDRDSHEPPKFSFEFVDREYVGAWSWPDRKTKDGTAIHARIMLFLLDISEYAWFEIVRLNGGDYHHEQGIDELCPRAQARITELGHDERVEKLFRLRLGDLERLWGFVIEGVFHVLWWDAKHQVYPLD
jgi:hypothetical protein